MRYISSRRASVQIQALETGSSEDFAARSSVTSVSQILSLYLYWFYEVEHMVKKTNKTTLGEQTGSQKPKSDSAVDVRMQMEALRKELHQLAQRAETELEKNLRELPAPILSMINRVATQASAAAVGVWFDLELSKSFRLDEFTFLELTEEDKLQCGLAWSGREMCFDFCNSKVYLPVVVFENPIAVAVLELPSMSSLNYESICATACRELNTLRTKLKKSDSPSADSMNAAS